jgi:hypothetical protein
MKSFNYAAPLLIAVVVLAGCASSKVTSRENAAGDEKIARPDRIIVQNFAATPADVADSSAVAGKYAAHKTPQTAEEIEVGRQLGAQVARELVVEIAKMGLPAVQAAGQPAPRVGDIVISGEFVSVDEGAAGKRVLIGFGSGAAKLGTIVEGHLMTDKGLRPLGSREIAASGGKTPGVLVGLAGYLITDSPIGLIAGSVVKLTGETGRETLSGMAKMTAKEIAKELRDAFEKQGWI